MAKIIELPKLSPTMEEGTLVRWAKNEGDKIDVDDLLAEVDTDKATMEFRAFDKGTLLKRLVGEGTTVKLGAPVAILGEPGEDISALLGGEGAPAEDAATDEAAAEVVEREETEPTEAVDGGATEEEAPAEEATDAVAAETPPGDELAAGPAKGKAAPKKAVASAPVAAAKRPAGAVPAAAAKRPAAAVPAAAAKKASVAAPVAPASKASSVAAPVAPASKASGAAPVAAASEASGAAPVAAASEGEAKASVVKQAPPRAHTPAPNSVPSTPGMPGMILLPVRAANGAAETRAGMAGGPTSPRVRRLARERGVALEQLRGSGDHGRITAEDLERGVPAVRADAFVRAGITQPRPEDTVRQASQMRKTIARRLTEAKRDVPHFYLEADLDVEAMMVMREQLNDGVDKEAKISVNDLFVRACALALREVPASNASWVDGTIVEHHRVDISIAVSIDDGLVTPVLRDADSKGIRTIAAEVKDLAARARAKKLKLEEMTGGVFSLSNLGMYGIDRFSAVINPPEGMILAIGATREVPVVKNGQIVPGKRCAVTLSCDHRVVDGALGAQFLKALRGLVERPVKILA